MNIKKQPLTTYAVTVKEMAKMVSKFYDDIALYSNNCLQDWFEYVKNIPYKEDLTDEIVARPRYIIQNNFADCKKKSILIGSWCKKYGYECRFIVSSSRKDKAPHHIYTEIKIGKNWVVADATYNTGRIGKELNNETYREVWEWHIK